MRFRRFCPTCGVQRPAVSYLCVICGSPVRLTAHQRSATAEPMAAPVSLNGKITHLPEARVQTEQLAAA